MVKILQNAGGAFCQRGDGSFIGTDTSSFSECEECRGNCCKNVPPCIPDPSGWASGIYPNDIHRVRFVHDGYRKETDYFGIDSVIDEVTGHSDFSLDLLRCGAIAGQVNGIPATGTMTHTDSAAPGSSWSALVVSVGVQVVRPYNVNPAHNYWRVTFVYRSATGQSLVAITHYIHSNLAAPEPGVTYTPAFPRICQLGSYSQTQGSFALGFLNEQTSELHLYPGVQNCNTGAIQTSAHVEGCGDCPGAEELDWTSMTGGTPSPVPASTPTPSVILPSAAETKRYGSRRSAAQSARV